MGRYRNTKGLDVLLLEDQKKKDYYIKKLEGCILIRLPKNINSGRLIDNTVRSPIVTYNNNKKEGI